MDTTEDAMSIPGGDKDELIGAWKLVSFVVEDVTTKERKPLYGEHPKGYFMFLPSGRAAVLITSENRKVPTTAEESQVAFQSMIAFSGKCRVEEGKCIINVDVASHESWVGTEQIRLYHLEGETLHLERPAGPSPDVARMTRSEERRVGNE